ncbi:MAG: ATP synthase F1 subunit gamma [Candidatus Pacebacteria bacterium]|nr:ATP synthase F1 subunit gamma [Candidatus Paceibacterota bacterium]
MQSLRDIKKRIKSVKNIEQITKAMEVVSMTKMRKSQGYALRARPYAIAAFEMLENLLTKSPKLPELLKSRKLKTSLLVIVTADKGLVGAFNDNIVRKAQNWMNQKQEKGESFKIITIGKKAKEYCDRKKIAVIKSFLDFGDYSEAEEALPVGDMVLSGFIAKEWDAVDIIYTHFRTTLRQETVLRKILPVTKEGIEEIIRGIVPEYGKFSNANTGLAGNTKHRYNFKYKFEPSPVKILDILLPELLRLHIYHVILESNASEHSARMITMKNASDNAKELKGELNLSYNQARQSGITAQLSEIIAGSEALES